MSKSERGTIFVTYSGVGFLKVPGTAREIKIRSENLGTALHGDEVEIKDGKVAKIIRRARDEFVGTIKFEKGKNYAFLTPDDKRVYFDIFLPNATRSRAKDNYKALVRIVKWPKKTGKPRETSEVLRSRNPEGKIVRIIGRKGESNAEIKSIVYEKGLSIGFPPAVVKEAKVLEGFTKPLTGGEVARRRDFRSIPTFTIDPDDAKDFDDALSVRKTGGSWEIGVHIADVPRYVKPGSAIDKEARKRGVSVYLVDRTVPMLPEVLSNDVCSLNPDEDKLTFSVVFEITPDAGVKKTWFGETIIKSGKRFTYEEAQSVLDKRGGVFHGELHALNELALILREKRIKNGALDFDETEVKFELDREGKPIRVYEKPRLQTNKLVEEFMILANRAVAERFGRKIPKDGREIFSGIFRVHEAPDPTEIGELLRFLRGLGYDIRVKGAKMFPGELNELFAKVKDRPEEFLVKSVVMRAMEKAIYSTKREGHFGLALEHYTHFTSPIRRYADLIVHRILKKHLGGELVSKEERKECGKIAREVTEKEIRALEAERESVALKQVEYMLQRTGETFEGIISGITERGFFVQELTTKANGMVHLRDLKNDFYRLDRENYSLTGERTNKRFFLGDRVKFRVAGGDPERKTLDFILV